MSALLTLFFFSSSPSSLAAALTGPTAGQLAPITADEFATLPSFVQSQIELDFANDALSALKQCIIDTELKPAEVVLTPTQLRWVPGSFENVHRPCVFAITLTTLTRFLFPPFRDDLGLGAKAKVFLLLSLKLKRLSVGVQPLLFLERHETGPKDANVPQPPTSLPAPTLRSSRAPTRPANTFTAWPRD